MKKRIYGQWAGNPHGVPEDPAHCVQEMFSDYVGRQCSRKRGHGEDGLYCKQHAKRHPAQEKV